MADYHTVNINQKDMEWLEKLAEENDFKNVKELMMYATRKYKERKKQQELDN